MKKHRFYKTAMRSFTKAFSLPNASVPDTCELYVNDNQSLYVSSHSGITCADENCIALKCDGFTLKIYGGDLCIDAATDQSAVIRGKLSQICFD